MDRIPGLVCPASSGTRHANDHLTCARATNETYIYLVPSFVVHVLRNNWTTVFEIQSKTA